MRAGLAQTGFPGVSDIVSAMLYVEWHLAKKETILRHGPAQGGSRALACLLFAVFLSGHEAAYVQVVTTKRFVSPELFSDSSFLFLFALDMLVPLTLALLSRRVFLLCLLLQCLLSTMLLHYEIFFYNTLTLSTIYHSMHGASYLGINLFSFARWDIILATGILLGIKAGLVLLSRVPDFAMPGIWKLRGVVAVTCMTVCCWIAFAVHGKTGLNAVWADIHDEHRPALERRSQDGARESVRTIGYMATWLGELLSGTYRDTALIYAETRCPEPDAASNDTMMCGEARWYGLPVPERGQHIAMIQMESLDYAALGMHSGGQPVTPFLNSLMPHSLLLRAFAPHKVGSSNSDYELLNSREATQNVMYYSYIRDYPDSVIHMLRQNDYRPAALHGMEGNLFNMREAYRLQGFERLFFKEELLDEGYAPSEWIMEHIADADVFDRAAAYIEQGEGDAVFVVTMSSHIPFIEPRPEFAAKGTFARYISSLHYADEGLAAFYARLPAGTLCIIWGDHGSDVTYPSAYPANGRHVPFLVHVKGDDAWLKTEPAPEAERVYTLCDLSHYLRRILR